MRKSAWRVGQEAVNRLSGEPVVLVRRNRPYKQWLVRRAGSDRPGTTTWLWEVDLAPAEKPAK